MTGSGQPGTGAIPSRYDATLFAIPALFFLTGLVAMVFDVNHLLAFGIASLASVLLVADSLFVNPPVGTGFR
ncbi:MAG: hypothetical protein ABEJ84_00310 [Halodesulfurarchaeum sp.]